MEGYKKNFLDINEIDLIQQEIERSLYGAINASSEVKGLTPGHEQNYETLTTPNPIIELKPDASPDVFSHVAIKKEKRLYKKKSFWRAAAIAITACALGAGALGIGLGTGYPLVMNYLFPGIKTENSGNYIINDIGEYTAESDVRNNPKLNPADERIIIKSITDIIKLAAPSVVSIRAEFKASSDFFSMPYTDNGSGSGIIFDRDSENIFIVTNYHVVTGASSVRIRIGESADIKASFVGSNPEADIAVISVSIKNVKKAGVSVISIASFGDSDKMQVGDPVIAIGNALGEGTIVTSGIVSAMNKEVSINELLLTVIQTDAAINPGNSGGPLININGEVIGINTAKLSRSDAEGIEGMGYSISSNIVKPILDDIMNPNPKPFLGIQGSDLTKEVADYFQIPCIGVIVREIIPNSGAEKAGINRTDIITSFNGTTILSMKHLQEEIKKCSVGDEVTVKLFRDGTTQMELKVRLSEYKTDDF